MNLRITTLCCACSAAILLTGSITSFAHAQSPRACDDFATRSIRVEPGGFMRSTKIVRGSAGTEVLKLGFRTAKLDTLMQVSDSAQAYAIQYGRNARRGTVLMGLTLVTSFVVPLLVDFDDGRNEEIKWTSRGVTFGLGLWGASSQRRANRSLSRAVWHYNLSVEQNARADCDVTPPVQAESPARP